MRRAKCDIHECDGLAHEQSCISYLIGRMPVHAKKQKVSWDEHVKIKKEYKPMAELVLSNIEKSYKDEKVLNNINISMKNGVHGLVGANGAGKTTLMKIICDLLKYDGEVSYNSTNVKQMGEKYRKHEHNQKV